MLAFLKSLLLLIMLTTQGCQLLTSYQSSEEKTSKAEKEQEQVYHLLRQGNRYSERTTSDQQLVCNQLKQDYQKFKDWQTAWLLVYSLNNDFHCLSLKETVELLKTVQTNQDIIPSLHWFNGNQIKLLNKLNTLHARNYKLQKKNNKLNAQLTKTKAELQEVTTKIQALKVIETTINQKTQQ